MEMKELLEQLKNQGWHLTEEGLRKVMDATSSSTETIDVKKIIATAMNFDFREIANGALPKELSRKEEDIPGKIVLQIQKIRNISAPKANEESTAAPRLLQLELADGSLVIQALELERISILSLNTPPGTKVFFKPDRIKLMAGIIVLQANEVQLIGGNVTSLVEKWEMARKFQKYARLGRRISGASGPPPWIAFGKKIESKENFSNDRNFKSLSQANKSGEKDKDSKENSEFNAMRSEAIAEAARCGAKKVFGGGNQQIIDHNMKKILEKGYSEEEAKNALRSTGNNLERALYNLKRREDYKNRDDNRDKSSKIVAGKHGRVSGRETGRRGEFRNGNGGRDDPSIAAKPVSNVSLFDFLTEKFPSNSEPTSASVSQATVLPTTNQQSSSKPVTKPDIILQESSNTKVDNKSTKSNVEPSKSSSGGQKSNSGYQDRNKANESRSNYKTQGQQQKSDKSSSQPKFENNLSSSFAANRTTPNPFRVNRDHDEYERPSNRQSGRGRRGGRGGGGGGAGGNVDSNYNVRGGNENNRHNNATNNSNSTVGNNNKNNRSSHDRSAGGSNVQNSYQANVANTDNRAERNQNSVTGNGSHYENRRSEKNSSNNEKATEKGNSRYNTKDNFKTSNHSGANNSISTEAHTNSKSEDQTSSINKVVEATSKMKIDKHRSGSSSTRSNHHQQQSANKQQNLPQQTNQQYPPTQLNPIPPPQQQQPTNLPLNFNNNNNNNNQLQQPTAIIQPSNNNISPLPNGFAYDPTKIIGFQNKETNEFALTLLKSQGIPLAAMSQNNSNNSVPFAGANAIMINHPNSTQISPPTAAIQMTPHPFTSIPFSVPEASIPIQIVQTNLSPFGINPNESWSWKIGDHCLAKYWDDGRYYDAKITGISDKTCVVLFIGYGNHEEVLKSDCLPITDAQHNPVNYMNTQPTNSMQILSSASPATGFSRGVPNRYRGERQVYVPPPKRDI